ncbi:MAG TPA: SLBB domain-containing protein [Mucilaginibacter sp.]|jgi:protein involved in polysaccharide export with SLBB domain|nr:SLBB domain-containing protein [Mucilaginibacter sp.]
MYKLINKPPILLFLFTCFFYFTAHAQSLPSDMTNVNVDQLTDAQIKQLVQQAAASGLSDAQLIQIAENKGLPATEAAKLQDRISAYRKTAGNQGGQSDLSPADSNQYSRRLNYKPDSNMLNKAARDSLYKARSKIFGASLFRSSSINFSPDLKLATPRNYIVGPSDELNISVYGNSLANWRLEVSPEGNINIPGAGLLNVSGKTIEQATEDIKRRLIANHYAIGNGTSVQVNLGNIRSIKVIMVGELVRPGTYTLPSLATAFNALYAAGGPNDNGSFRNIQIIRNSRIVRTLDIYDFLTKGDQKSNIVLEDQDIIRVPAYRLHVEMQGQIKTPAIFEPLPGETLQDIISFAGGFTDKAYTALIKVSQISDQQRRITDIPEADFKNYIPLRGDLYTVDSVLNRYENRVTIKGAVFRPGDYELQKGLTLTQVINMAAGLKEDAFMGLGSIIRLEPDNTTEVVPFNLRDVMNKSVADIALQREDVVNISSIFDLRDSYTVTIKGAVRNAGDYVYSDSLSVEGLIVRAGGFSQGASTKRIEVARRTSGANPNMKNTPVAVVFKVDVDSLLNGTARFALKPFDIVSVYAMPGYEKQKTVKVEGEVLYPGYYTIQKKDEKISDIIGRAGGLTIYADAEGGTLRRENIAILGLDKNKADTAEVARERISRLERLRERNKDSTSNEDIQQRNNYVGIDLKGILEKPGTSIDLMVDDGDLIRIPKQEQVVTVNGQVLYPSAIVYDKGESFNNYVLHAGGYAPGALRRGAYVVYPNGAVRGTRKVLFFNSHPDVRPGSEIFIPKRPERKSSSLQEILGFTTGLVSLVVLLVTVRKL